ncbi:MAG TPA: OmpA family protein [Stellaceae bacterium]|nr:OmpA family protein [Stellaceae bacterium]
MKHAGLLLTGLAMCLLIAAPARAQNGVPQGQTTGFYLGVEGAWSRVMNFTDSASGDGLQFHTALNPGFAAGGDFGYDFGRVRLEAELVYRRSTVQQTRITAGGSGFPPLTGQTTPIGDAAALGGMANVMVDLLPHSRWTPYVGAGVGGARIALENYQALGVTFVDQKSWQLAYQGIAGVRYQGSPAISLSLDYRYFATMDVSLRDGAGASFKIPYASHNVMLGIAYHFGAPSPPPPRAAAPPAIPVVAPASLPAPPALPSHNFIVYFNFDRSDLTPDGRKTVEDAAASFKQTGSARIAIDGYTDLAGSAIYNLKLSKRRADAVHAYLVRLGVPDGAIQQSWHGKENPAVPTPDGTREPRNRRVEIVF